MESSSKAAPLQNGNPPICSASSHQTHFESIQEFSMANVRTGLSRTSVVKPLVAYTAVMKAGGSVTPENNSAVLLGDSVIVARKGQFAPGSRGARFHSFSHPKVNVLGEVAFLASVVEPGEPGSSHEGLFVRAYDSATQSHSLRLAALASAPAPGIPGAIITSIGSYVLQERPRATYRLLFTANFSANARGHSKQIAQKGLWAQDDSGALTLLLKTGNAIYLGRGVSKTLRDFALVISAAGFGAPSYSFTEKGALVYEAFFTDGTRAILTIKSPLRVTSKRASGSASGNAAARRSSRFSAIRNSQVFAPALPVAAYPPHIHSVPPVAAPVEREAATDAAPPRTLEAAA